MNNLTEENTTQMVKEPTKKKKFNPAKPTAVYVGAAWAALGIGLISYCVGLWNATMVLNEKGYYFTIILFGLFSAISVQKNVRDKAEGIPVTDIYYGISWFTTFASITLLVVGLRHADLELSEKGFYAMAFTLALFSAITVQKNTRDVKAFSEEED